MYSNGFRKESVEEKNTFEKKEEMEIDQEEMEVKTLEKHERLEWKANRFCKEILKEIVDGLERAADMRNDANLQT